MWDPAARTLPIVHEARTALRRQVLIACVFSTLWLAALVVLAIPGRDERASEIADGYRLAATFAVPWAAFTIFVIVRLRQSYAQLRILDTGIQIVVFGRAREFPWSKIGSLRLRSRSPSDKLGRLAVNAALSGVAQGVGSPLTVHVHEAVNSFPPDNPFAGPGPARQGRVAFGAICGPHGGQMFKLGEMFDWPAYDDLVFHALARGVAIEADGARVSIRG